VTAVKIKNVDLAYLFTVAAFAAALIWQAASPLPPDSQNGPQTDIKTTEVPDRPAPLPEPTPKAMQIPSVPVQSVSIKPEKPDSTAHFPQSSSQDTMPKTVPSPETAETLPEIPEQPVPPDSQTGLPTTETVEAKELPVAPLIISYGKTRTVDSKQIRKQIRKGRLSDREAEFYSKK